MAKIKKIKLVDLLVNPENYRFEPVDGQKEAIDKMIDDQGEKLVRLAEDIIANGLNPNDKIQVVASSHDSSKFIVVEGNRRTVTLKLLNNPDLIDNPQQLALKRKFKKLHDDNRSALIKITECTVYDDPSEGNKWIKLKHAGQFEGIGTVTWTAQQIDRFEELVEGKSSIALQAITLLEKSKDVPVDLKKDLPKLPVSSLERLISDPDVRKFLGVELNNGMLRSDIQQSEVVKGLTHIAKDLLSSKFKVGNIYTKEDRKDYIRSIPNGNRPNIKLKSSEAWMFNGNTSQESHSVTKKKIVPKDRSKLIPKKCVLTISYPKVNALYQELQKLSVFDFTNLVAIGFRVFIEFSMDCYIASNKLTTTKEFKPLNKETSLSQKIIEVANDLEAKKIADKHMCTGIRHAATSPNGLLGVKTTLHAYVHNALFSPIPSDMIVTWNNIQPFIEKVWENIK